MQKIISMLLIGLMLTGCGQIKNFIHPETKVDPKINADLAEIKAELAALKAKNAEGWWNWRLSEDGWMSWINTGTIASTIGVAFLASSGYFFYKGHSVASRVDNCEQGINNNKKNFETFRDTAYKPTKQQVDENTLELSRQNDRINAAQTKGQEVVDAATKVQQNLNNHGSSKVYLAHPNG